MSRVKDAMQLSWCLYRIGPYMVVIADSHFMIIQTPTRQAISIHRIIKHQKLNLKFQTTNWSKIQQIYLSIHKIPLEECSN